MNRCTIMMKNFYLCLRLKQYIINSKKIFIYLFTLIFLLVLSSFSIASCCSLPLYCNNWGNSQSCSGTTGTPPVSCTNSNTCTFPNSPDMIFTWSDGNYNTVPVTEIVNYYEAYVRSNWNRACTTGPSNLISAITQMSPIGSSLTIQNLCDIDYDSTNEVFILKEKESGFSFDRTIGGILYEIEILSKDVSNVAEINLVHLGSDFIELNASKNVFFKIKSNKDIFYILTKDAQTSIYLGNHPFNKGIFLKKDGDDKQIHVNNVSIISMLNDVLFDVNLKGNFTYLVDFNNNEYNQNSTINLENIIEDDFLNIWTNLSKKYTVSIDEDGSERIYSLLGSLSLFRANHFGINPLIFNEVNNSFEDEFKDYNTMIYFFNPDLFRFYIDSEGHYTLFSVGSDGQGEDVSEDYQEISDTFEIIEHDSSIDGCSGQVISWEVDGISCEGRTALQNFNDINFIYNTMNNRVGIAKIKCNESGEFEILNSSCLIRGVNYERGDSEFVCIGEQRYIRRSVTSTSTQTSLYDIINYRNLENTGEFRLYVNLTSSDGNSYLTDYIDLGTDEYENSYLDVK
ncbi:MAG: hypothetical protein ACOC3Z_02635, partial [Nanoarchaeota archaeon]